LLAYLLTYLKDCYINFLQCSM